MEDQPTRIALARNGARPPVTDLALRAAWSPLPLSLREARPLAQALRHRLGPAPAARANPDGAPAVLVEEVGFSYGTQPVLVGTSLTLRRGEVAVLMGRNGSGKTTLLKLIAGILRPARGRVRTDARVTLLPQDADTLLFAPTVRAELDGSSLDAALGPPEWLDRFPRDMSAGERQRVAIAVTCARAEVLLLDEPTRGLDPEAKASLATYLRARAESGAAVLIATHDVEWAARITDRAMLMADGEIYAEGSPRVVLSDALVFSTQVNKLLGQGWLLSEEIPLEVRPETSARDSVDRGPECEEATST